MSESVAPLLPCYQGVRGCTFLGEHYHPDEKYAKDAPPVSEPDLTALVEAWANEGDIYFRLGEYWATPEDLVALAQRAVQIGKDSR